jgi:hypothetical protein
MVRLAIRDDDTNFFTKVEDLEYVYKDFNGFPISFAVVPHILDVSTKGSCPETKGNTVSRHLDMNHELCDWLREKYAHKECDILLHGISHQYKFLGNKRLPEMIWRSKEETLVLDLANAKKYLEDTLKCNISVFVAPSNMIAKSCLDAAIANNMNFSGIIPIDFQRSFTARNILSYLKRVHCRVVTKLAYPGVLQYSDHLEINACPLRSLSYLKTMYEFCEKKDLPMAINVHYWHLRDNPEYHNMLRTFVMDFAIPRGATPTLLSDLLK